jgi:hypothetical protein
MLCEITTLPLRSLFCYLFLPFADEVTAMFADAAVMGPIFKRLVSLENAFLFWDDQPYYIKCDFISVTLEPFVFLTLVHPSCIPIAKR